MRRAPIVLTATATGLAAVLSFDAHEPQLPAASASSSATPPASPTSTPAAGGSSSGTRTATGDAIDTRYGAAQVRVTVSGGKITNVEAHLVAWPDELVQAAAARPHQVGDLVAQHQVLAA